MSSGFVVFCILLTLAEESQIHLGAFSACSLNQPKPLLEVGRSRDPRDHMTRGTTWLRPREGPLAAAAPGCLASSGCWCWRSGRQRAKRPGLGKARRPSRARADADRPSGPGPTAAQRPRSSTPGSRTPRAWPRARDRSHSPRCAFHSFFGACGCRRSRAEPG